MEDFSPSLPPTRQIQVEISLWTGRKPTLRTYEMICYYFTGMADEDELLAHIAKLKPQAV